MSKADRKRVTVTIVFDLISDLNENQVKKSIDELINKIDTETTEVFCDENVESLGLSRDIKISTGDTF